MRFWECFQMNFPVDHEEKSKEISEIEWIFAPNLSSGDSSLDGCHWWWQWTDSSLLVCPATPGSIMTMKWGLSYPKSSNTSSCLQVIYFSGLVKLRSYTIPLLIIAPKCRVVVQICSCKNISSYLCVLNFLLLSYDKSPWYALKVRDCC